MAYRHTQRVGLRRLVDFGVPFLFGLAALTALYLHSGHFWWMGLGIWLVGAVLVNAMFWALTVEIQDGKLEIGFEPPGINREQIALVQIESAEVHKVPWYLGMTFGGGPAFLGTQLWKVSGSDAIRLRLSESIRDTDVFRGAATVLIGTDEPEKLLGAIRAATGARPS